MKTIKRLKMRQNKFTGKRGYTLFTYVVEDDLGNLEDIDSLQEYELGARVETWFDDRFNKAKMRPYKSIRVTAPKDYNGKLNTTSEATDDEIDKIEKAVEKYLNKD